MQILCGTILIGCCCIHRRRKVLNTVELQWLEHLRDHENMFETGVVPANE